VLDGQYKPYPAVARHYKASGLSWIAVGDQNYGEGSSREHAAMCPRFLQLQGSGCGRQLCSHHETNLKKQGILALTFANPADLRQDPRKGGRIDITGLAQLAPEKPVEMTIKHADGKLG